MAKEQVLRFLERVSWDEDVNSDVATAEVSVDAWVASAQKHGFQFTADDFRSVAKDVLGGEIHGDSFIEELIEVNRPDRELEYHELEAVAGGAGYQSGTTASLQLKPALMQRIKTSFGGDLNSMHDYQP